MVSYAVEVSPSETPATHYERWSRTNLHEYLQQVFFHPAALPADCHRYVREKVGDPPRGRRRIPLSDAHDVHVLTSRCKPGVHEGGVGVRNGTKWNGRPPRMSGRSPASGGWPSFGRCLSWTTSC